MKQKKLKSWLVARLRRQHMAWPPKQWCKSAARVGRNQYRCADCSGIFTGKEVELDHIEPVVDFDGNMTDGEFDWHKTVTRMFCQQDGYQVLCVGCHIIKQYFEIQLRSEHRGDYNNMEYQFLQYYENELCMSE